MKDIILNLAKTEGSFQSPIKELRYAIRRSPTNYQNCLYTSSCIFVLQGSKEMIHGTNKYKYERGKYLLTSIDLPVSSKITKANNEAPFVVVILKLNQTIIRGLIGEINDTQIQQNNDSLLGCSEVDDNLLDAFFRLVLLLEKSQEEQRVLSPIIIKEIHYRLLTGKYGELLVKACTKGTKENNITKAIDILTHKFDKGLNMEDVAKEVSMAPSSFYKNFKDATNTTPLQFQKILQLNEAQRLLLTGAFDASTVAFKVGYKSPNQFSREYKRYFGASPMRSLKSILEYNP